MGKDKRIDWAEFKREFKEANERAMWTEQDIADFKVALNKGEGVTWRKTTTKSS